VPAPVTLVLSGTGALKRVKFDPEMGGTVGIKVLGEILVAADVDARGKLAQRVAQEMDQVIEGAIAIS
jgi:DNA-binding protein YbaB